MEWLRHVEIGERASLDQLLVQSDKLFYTVTRHGDKLHHSPDSETRESEDQLTGTRENSVYGYSDINEKDTLV